MKFSGIFKNLWKKNILGKKNLCFWIFLCESVFCKEFWIIENRIDISFALILRNFAQSYEVEIEGVIFKTNEHFDMEKNEKTEKNTLFCFFYLI